MVDVFFRNLHIGDAPVVISYTSSGATSHVNCIRLTLTNGVLVWRGNITFATKHPALRITDESSFFDKIRSSLSVNMGGNSASMLNSVVCPFEFDIRGRLETDNQIIFIIKEHVKGACKHIAEITLVSDSTPSEGILDMLLDAEVSIFKLSSRQLFLEDECSRLQKQVNSFHNIIERFLAGKSRYETQLLANFCSVINEKKMEINRLNTMELAGQKHKMDEESKVIDLASDDVDSKMKVKRRRRMIADTSSSARAANIISRGGIAEDAPRLSSLSTLVPEPHGDLTQYLT